MILAGPSRTSLQLHRTKDVLNVFPAVLVEYIALRRGVGDRVVNRLLQLSKHTDLIIETFDKIVVDDDHSIPPSTPAQQ
jgi:hypothetical protein